MFFTVPSAAANIKAESKNIKAAPFMQKCTIGNGFQSDGITMPQTKKIYQNTIEKVEII